MDKMYAIVFSPYSQFSYRLVKRLSDRGFEVVVVSDDKLKWRFRKIKSVRRKNIPSVRYELLFAVEGVGQWRGNLKKVGRRLEKVFGMIAKKASRNYIILPDERMSEYQRRIRYLVSKYVEDNKIDTRLLYVSGKSDKSIEKLVNDCLEGYSTGKKYLKDEAAYAKLSHKPFMYGLGVIAILLVLPYVVFFVSCVGTVLSYNNIKAGRLGVVRDLSKFSILTSRVSRGVFYNYSKVPLVGSLFVGSYNSSVFVGDVNGIINRGSYLVDELVEVFNVVMDESDGDVRVLAERVKLELDSLYKDISYIQSRFSRLPNAMRMGFDEDEIGKVASYVGAGRDLAGRMGELTGVNGRKTYLVLLQNNSELRPTGGFIGSFALVSFEGGRLIDVNVMDVYSADGQLKGHVEPPEAIKKYLGEANWYLRDSNWDGDFETSARRAEWFLEKEIDRSVDGVIGVDLALAELVLKVTGEVYLEDFDQRIDHKNIYERVQYEVESDFFPGSRKKENVLTALAREILNGVTEVTGERKVVELGRGIVELAEGRSIQIYLHDELAQVVFDRLGWDGDISISSCGEQCFVNYGGLLEANVGVNKANYFVERKLSTTSYIGEAKIDNYLNLHLENKSPEGSELFGRYKAYLRVIAPKGAIFEKTDEQEIEVVEYADRTEGGVLVEVGVGESVDVLFHWGVKHGVDVGEPGEVRFYWRKQAGTKGDMISHYVEFEDDRGITSEPRYFLTNGGGVYYNTDLLRDFSSRIFWK